MRAGPSIGHSDVFALSLVQKHQNVPRVPKHTIDKSVSTQQQPSLTNNLDDTKELTGDGEFIDPDKSDTEVVWDPEWLKQQCGASKTRLARKGALKKWKKFLKLYFKQSEDWVNDINGAFEKYAVWRFKTGTVSADSIDSEISHINHDLHDMGRGLDRKVHAVGTRHVLDGIKRTQGELFGISNGKQARDLTDRLCDPFVEHLNDYDGGIVMVTKHAVLRSDNVCVNKNRHHLCAKHVRVTTDVDGVEIVILDIPGSKTNQFDIPEERVLYHRDKMCNAGSTPTTMCPACVCKLNSTNRKQDDPLFTDEQGRYYSYKMLNDITKRCAVFFGLDSKYYTTHCLRRGGATDLFIKYGKSLDWIMVNCNWESKETVMKRYLKAHNPDFDALAIRFFWLRRR